MISIAIDQRCRARGRRASAAMLALSSLVPLACGDNEDASLCTAFDEFLDARAQVATVDPADESAAGAIDIVEDYLAGVRRLEQAADGRYGQELDGLETAVNDVLLTLESVQDDADYATWGPLVEDDLELAADAAVQVAEVIEPSCTSATSGT
jgi:hypothetical protein